MFGLLEGWLFTQLGISCNVSKLQENNIFCDGCVFVNILHKYGLVSSSFCENICPSAEKEECLQNLKLLKPLFNMLKIKYNETVINDIVENKTGTIINLLYELYICLENKQHLYFITKQNFDKVCQDALKNLNSVTVDENTPKPESDIPSSMCLEQPLLNNADVINWYKNKYEKVRNTLDAKVNHLERSLVNKERISVKSPCKLRFSQYKCTSKSELFEDLPDLNLFLKGGGDDKLLDYEAFIARYKAKQNSKAVKKCFESAIQHELLQHTWSKVEEKEGKVYDSVFSAVLLKQSNYEKQILSKLIQAQQETQVQNENKIWAKQSIIKEHENKICCDFELGDKFQQLENNFNNEQMRVLELHKKLYLEKQEIKKNEKLNICEDVVDSLLDIVMCAVEYKAENGVEVSQCLWSNWMQLFVKSQPIRVQLKVLEDSAGDDIDYDEALSLEKEKDEVLNENDIEEYLMTLGRWYYSSVCLEHADFNEVYLAFIVYRLLFLKYPLPPSPPAADLPPYKVTGVLLNCHSADSIEKLKLLLSKSEIHVFDTETAIKKCMKQFQTETAPPPEEKLKGKKKDSGPKQKGGKEKKKDTKKNSKKKDSRPKSSEKKKLKKSKKSEPTTDKVEGENIINVVEKETQTSLVIETEEEKSKRTTLGLLGEEVCNVLKEGGKLDDSLLASVITEYLKSLEECEGWLLLNYPETIDQAFHLELALTGKKIPMEGFALEGNQMLLSEELDGWSEKRKSKLLNYPMNGTDTQSSNSCFTVFVKIQDGNHEVSAPENKIFEEVNNQELNSTISDEFKEDDNGRRDFLKEFYINQAIYKEFPNTSFDINSLKLLARVILKEDGLDAKASIDLFGEETLNKLTKSKKPDKKSKSPKKTEKKAKSKPIKGHKAKDKPDEVLEMSSAINQETNAVVDIGDQEISPEKDASLENQNDLPTEESEQTDQKINFVSLPLNNEFGVLLATVWENIESCYITNLKEILFENRFINLRLYPYCIYVEKEMKKVIDKPDLKQNLIDFFQDYYNNISNELRTLPEMKNQLHCRVLELQQNLWEIADQRKNEIEAKRQDMIYENWFVSEICLLINNYLSFVQTEFERSFETLQLVNDYYMNMLEKTPPTLAVQQESRIVGRISSEMLLNKIHEKPSVSEQDKDDSSREVKTSNIIADSLVNCSDEETPVNIFETILSEKVTEVKSHFNAISIIFHNQNKTEANLISNSNKEKGKVKSTANKDKVSIKSKKEAKKSKSSTKSNEIQLEAGAEISIKESLIQEWQTTINTETERFNFRLDLIYQRAKENIFEFYCYLESVFCNLHKSILSRYNNEISNINSICNFLKTAIEEESLLEHPLILGQETFFVGIKDAESKLMDCVLKELEEDLHDCIFTVKQLYSLMDIFKISGPLGVIRKQPLCYILQDLMLMDTCDNHPYLPKMWGLLDEVQLRNVIDDIFGLEFGVDWRDFIIYNLDIPYPEVKDILHLRKQFVSLDLDETELVTEEEYENITLWFENELPSGPKQGLRFALVKKLLAELFKVDGEHINYTALLLYFCKDFDPVNGLKKALSLSLGKNVVISESELETILQDEEEINEVVCFVLKDIIDGIVLTRETAQVYDILESLSHMKLQSQESTEYSPQSSQFGSYKSGSFKSLELDSDKLDPESDQIEPDSETLAPPPPTPFVKKYSICFPTTPGNEKSWVTKIPVSSVLSVLNSSFFYQDRRFALKTQYLGCLEDEADADGMIEAYELVNLSCIQKLFTMTNKFKISNPCDILRDCLKDDKKNEDDSEMLKQHFKLW